MGSSHSVEKELFDEKYYKHIKEIKDDHYGTIKIMSSKETQELYALVTKTFQTNQMYSKRAEECQMRLALKHDNIVQLKKYFGKENLEFCASFWEIFALFEYLSYSLDKELEQRMSMGSFFSEKDIWYLIISTLSALNFLKGRGYYHGDIRPFNILLSECGQIKIMDNALLSPGISTYAQLLLGQTIKCYLSPQVFASAKRQKSVPDHNPSKSDVFSLGMTLLEMATLSSIKKCYDFEDFTVREQEIKILLKTVESLYSPILHNLITKMLAVDELERPDIDLVYEYVNDLLRNKEINMSTAVSIESKSICDIQEPTKAPANPPAEKPKERVFFAISEDSNEDEKSWDYGKKRGQKPNVRYEEILTPLKEEFEMMQRTQQSEQKAPIDSAVFNKNLTEPKQENLINSVKSPVSEFKHDEKIRDRSEKKNYLDGLDNKVIEALKFSEEVLNRYKEIPLERLSNLTANSKISNRFSTGKKVESFNKENILGALTHFDVGGLNSSRNINGNENVHYYTANSKLTVSRREEPPSNMNMANSNYASLQRGSGHLYPYANNGINQNVLSSKISVGHNTQDFFSEREDSFYRSLINQNGCGNYTNQMNISNTSLLMNNNYFHGNASPQHKVLENIINISINSKKIPRGEYEEFVTKGSNVEKQEKDFKKAHNNNKIEEVRTVETPKHRGNNLQNLFLNPDHIIPRSPGSDMNSIYPKSCRSDSNARSSVCSSSAIENPCQSKDQSSDHKKSEISKLSRISEGGYNADNSFAKENAFRKKMEHLRNLATEGNYEAIGGNKRLEPIQELSQHTLYNKSSENPSLQESGRLDNLLGESKNRNKPTNAIVGSFKKPTTVYGKPIY